jgi:hypothetical protein
MRHKRSMFYVVPCANKTKKRTFKIRKKMNEQYYSKREFYNITIDAIKRKK